MDVKPVIVGIDGSPDSVRAVTWAADYARQVDAPLQGVIAWEVSTLYGDTFGGKVDLTAVKEKHRSVLDETVQKALGDDAQVEPRVEKGNPAAVLVKASKEAQLVVVGSRGLGSFAGMLLGSVSQQLVSHAECPVLVLPTEGAKKKRK